MRIPGIEKPANQPPPDPLPAHALVHPHVCDIGETCAVADRTGEADLLAVAALVEHAAGNVMTDPDDIGRFYDRCSDLMRALLDGLAEAPDRPRIFPEIEAAIEEALR